MTTELASTPEAPPVVETNEREAIIFIPAIGKPWDDPSIEGVARRISIAIDRQSITEKAKTHVEVAEQDYGSSFKCKMFTIVKKDANGDRPLIDVFGLDYNDTLVESYVKRTLFTKTLLLVVTLIDGFRRLLFRFYRRGKSLKEKLQLAYGLMIAGLLVVYLVILITAVVSSVEQLIKKSPPANQQTQTTSKPGPTTAVVPPAEAGVSDTVFGGINTVAGGVWDGIRSVWTFIRTQRSLFPPIIVLLTAVGFVVPPKAQLKERISLAATNYLCLIHYLNWGERSHAIGGKLEALIEHLVERDQVYKKIHIIGYSFGSIVAVDNLFGLGRKPIDRFERIDTLVTIGCPFDIIRTYWPAYFTGRQSGGSAELKWINVYSPIDILSSNFADAGNESRVDESKNEGVGIEVGDKIYKPESIRFSQGSSQVLGLLDILTLTGFKAHTLYWGEEVKGEITCFHTIVEEMYKGTPVLN